MYRNGPTSAEPVDPAIEQNRQAGDVATEIRDVLAHLKRRRSWIGVVAVIAAFLGIALAAKIPRLYTATSQIMVDPRGLRVDDQVVPAGQVPDAQSFLAEAQSRVLKSDSVIQPVVEQEHLASDREFNGEPRSPLGAAWERLGKLFSGRKTDDPEAVALANFDDAVRVRRIPASFVLELSVRSEDAEKAARLARDITETYFANREQARQEAAKRVSEGLAKRLDELGAEVNRAEKAVGAFKRQNNIAGATGQLVSEQQLEELTSQLTDAHVHAGQLRARYQQVQRVQHSGAMPDATTEAVQSPTVTALRTRYAVAKQIEDNLLSTVGPRHPSLVAAHAETAGLRRLIADEVGRIAATARSDYERARASEETLSRDVDSIARETGSANTAAIRSRELELEREAQARRTIYESFLARSREAHERGDPPVDNIAVISAATAPLKPGGTPPVLIVLVATVFGAIASALGVLVLDRLRGRLITPRQLGRATGLPMLAVAGRRSAKSLGLFGIGRKAEPTSALATSAQDLATLRSALDDIAPQLVPRIILFLSGSGRAADAWLPVDLAGSACESGSRVLFIDADYDAMTRPLATAAVTDPNAWPDVKKTGIRNLSVLSWNSALVRPLAAEGGGMSNMFLRLAADHDYVFIHASVPGSALRARTLAATATNIVLTIDSEAATLSDINAIRREVGPFASKVGGFIWVSSARQASEGPWATGAQNRTQASRMGNTASTAARPDAA